MIRVAAALVVVLVLMALIARHVGSRRRLAHRAEQQNTWALEGDPRGVYGEEGARVMASLDKPSVVGDWDVGFPADRHGLARGPVLEVRYPDRPEFRTFIAAAAAAGPSGRPVLAWGGETIRVLQSGSEKWGN